MDAVLEEKLRQLVDVFLKENAKVNLSAFRTEETCWIGNILDSLAFHIPHTKYNILDVGTGGGFPLLPLAMMFPESHFTGLDATKKKIDAIGRIVKEMKITNVELIADRAESLGKNAKYRERFDVVTARAVADIAVLLEYCSPFVNVGGHVILWKSLEIDAELKESEKAQQELHAGLISKHVYELPGDFGKRQLLVFKKTAPTPKGYPRAVGVAKKKPL